MVIFVGLQSLIHDGCSVQECKQSRQTIRGLTLLVLFVITQVDEFSQVLLERLDWLTACFAIYPVDSAFYL